MAAIQAVTSTENMYHLSRVVDQPGILYFYEENFKLFMQNRNAPRWEDSLNLLDSLTVSLSWVVVECCSALFSALPLHFCHDIFLGMVTFAPSFQCDEFLVVGHVLKFCR